ncbi:unnamed protein product [Symbiodinium pilosum]|uniref:Uncharacterized protein n=1 Tax=Symbiodinium pilosum TaxID=2952 RepID=A0A812XXF0_SYMPI|nr:unnamed protein product [Symbiodinium pilosum]
MQISRLSAAASAAAWSEGEIDEDCCSLDGMREGYKVLLHLLKILEEHSHEPVDEEMSADEETKEVAPEQDDMEQEVTAQPSELVDPVKSPEDGHTAPPTTTALSRPLCGRRAMSLDNVGMLDEQDELLQQRALSDGGTPRAPQALPSSDAGMAERQGREGGREAGRPTIAMPASTSMTRSFPAAFVPLHTTAERPLAEFSEDASAQDAPGTEVTEAPQENRAADSPQGEEAWFSWLGALYG